MSLLSPIQVVAIRYLPASDGKVGFVFGLSHQVKNFDKLDISLVDREGNPIEFQTQSAVAQRRDLSNSWQINIDASNVSNDKQHFTLQISKSSGDSAETADGHGLFRKFLIHIDLNRNLETDMLHSTYELAERQVYPQANELLTTLNTVLNTELDNIRELTSFEEGLQFAQLRSLEILRAQYEYFSNPFYNDLDEQLEAPFAYELETEISALSSKLEKECKEETGQAHRAKFFT